MFFAAPNWVVSAVAPCVPWEFVPSGIPADVRGTSGKAARDKWMSNPDTKHQVYCSFEGLNPGEKIKDSRGVNEGNPPLKCHALVGDYDAPLTPEELETGIKRLGSFVPNYIERTLSGNIRLIWLLEKPVSFPNMRFAREWLQLAMGKMNVEAVAVKFDKPAWLEPSRAWVNSGEWGTYAPDARVPFAVANGWIVETAEKHVWRKDKGAVEIPLPEVFREIEKRFPQHNWQGDFVEDAAGPSFWLPDSKSPKSAKVKTTGMYTFSGSAIKPFYSWADLLGAQFVQEFAAKMMGKAVEGIYHDGTVYYRTTGYGAWKSFAKEDICSHLRVDRGLSSQKNGDVPSDVDRAVQYIQNWQGIDGAAPFVFQPSGILKLNGRVFLNTHTRRVLQPSAGGEWPWLKAYFNGLFDPPVQLDYFFSWLARFYQGAYNYALEGGQNVFILGAPGVGKTFLSQGILPKLFGGSEDAEDFLLGQSQFNSQLFEVAVLTVDDNSATVDAATHRKFSAMIKKLAANQQFSFHAKFRTPCEIRWLGRVIITANDDEESARIVPDMSISIMDKLMLFRTAKTPHINFPGQKEMAEILANELPHFARFLLDYQIPEHCKGTSRFGVKAYHEPSLLETAEQSSRSAGFHEIIDDWAQGFFAETKELYWEGTAWQLVKTLHQGDVAVSSALRSITADVVSRNLMSLKSKGFEIEARSERGSRLWRINKPKKK